MPIVLIYFRPLSLASRRSYSKIIQVSLSGAEVLGWCDVHVQVLGWWDVEVLGWCDAGPWMVECWSPDGVMCRSSDVQILETETGK